jgi:Family of unknown function (DUF5309)
MSTGILTTSAWTEDLAVKSFAGSMVRLMPAGMATLFGMTSMLKTETALATEHGFFSKTMIFPQLTISVAASASDTALTVTSTDNIIPGQLFQAPGTSEQIMVESVISANQVAVRRAVGNVNAAAISAAARLFSVGNAYEEGSNRPAALNINPVKITNLTAIFRNSWALTDTARSIPNIAGETNIAESRQDCAMFHAVDIEKQLFFGQKSAGVKNGKPFRTMDGLIANVGNLTYYPSSYSAVNVYTAGGTTNFTQLQNFLEPCLNQSTDPKVGNERIVFTGGTGKRVINDIGRVNGTYYLMDGQTNWGLQFSTFKTARGTFRMIEHPLFNSNDTWARMAVVVDLSTFSVAYLNDRKTQTKDYNLSGNIAADNGVDAVGGTLTTELTCLVKNPPANAVIYNLTAGAQG